MKQRAYRLIPVLLAAWIVFSMTLTAYAAELKVGSVKGLPEKLVVLDDNGNSVSENGEYFFEVENMKESEVYTKKIQIMNLREDASYRIFFNAHRVESSGEIDLENECKCSIYMDDVLVYSGKVTGEGTPDMRDDPLMLGLYHPGDSRVMTVSVSWVSKGYGGQIDNGARIVDHNGTSVIREKSGKDHVEGETIFRWIFTAIVEDAGDRTSSDGPSEISSPDEPPISTVSTESYPGSPESGYTSGGGGDDNDSPRRPSGPGGNNILDFVQTGDTIAFIAIGVVAVAMLFMIVLLVGKKRKYNNKSKETPK